MMKFGDMACFVKNVIQYSAVKVKDYIWNFKSDDLEYACEQVGVPYFPVDEPWENEEVFEKYKTAVLLIKKYVKELQSFHRKYYQDYCQYKHGLSAALAPMQNQLMQDDKEQQEILMENPLEGNLRTFHQGTIGQYKNGQEAYLPWDCF